MQAKQGVGLGSHRIVFFFFSSSSFLDFFLSVGLGEEKGGGQLMASGPTATIDETWELERQFSARKQGNQGMRIGGVLRGTLGCFRYFRVLSFQPTPIPIPIILMDLLTSSQLQHVQLNYKAVHRHIAEHIFTSMRSSKQQNVRRRPNPRTASSLVRRCNSSHHAHHIIR